MRFVKVFKLEYSLMDKVKAFLKKEKLKESLTVNHDIEERVYTLKNTDIRELDNLYFRGSELEMVLRLFSEINNLNIVIVRSYNYSGAIEIVLPELLGDDDEVNNSRDIMDLVRPLGIEVIVNSDSSYFNACVID